MSPVIVIFGANGFLGRYLCRHFTMAGREVVAVGRQQDGWSGDGMWLDWDGRSAGPWALALEGAEMVINLAGRSVNCRYGAENRRAILRSRLESTRVIGQAIAGCRVPPRLWFNAATATWYRHAEDKPQDEWTGEPGVGFSCEVARAWEEAFFGSAVPAQTRKVALRIGMVLANEPGTVFDVFWHLARLGMGGAMAGGRQRVSWIHMEDFLRAVEHVAGDPFLDGMVNVTAPDFPENLEWMSLFRHAAGMPLGLPASRWMLDLGARVLHTEAELVTKSRWAAPVRLRDAGFRWHFPHAAEAVANLQARQGLQGFFHDATRWAGGQYWQPTAGHPGTEPARSG